MVNGGRKKVIAASEAVFHCKKIMRETIQCDKLCHANIKDLQIYRENKWMLFDLRVIQQ